MKKVVGLILILAIIIAGAPLVVGSKVESHFRTQVDKLNANPSFNLAIDEYNKGWFESTATLTLDIALPPEMAALASENQLIIKQKIQHGPVLWQGSGLGLGLMDAQVNFELPAAMQQQMQKVAAFNQELLNIQSRTDFDLATSTQLQLKAFTINESGTMVDVLPAEGEFYYNMEGKLEGQLVWQGMKAEQTSSQSITVGEMKLSTQQQLVMGDMFSPNALFNGDADFNVAKIAVVSDDPLQNMSLNNLNLNAATNIETGLMEVTSNFSIESLEAMQQRFDNIQLNLSIDNLDTVVIQKMNESLSQSQNADPMAVAAQLQGALPDLIAKNPVLKINKLGMQTHAGLIDSDMKVNIDQTVYDPANPMTMMLALQAEANGFAPEAFFTGFGLGPTIEELVKSNYLERDQTNLTFKFRFKDGQALLNGQPIPLGM